MDQPVVKFNTQDQPEFFKALRKNVNNYFKENNISKYANMSMVLKTVFMLSLYFGPMILLLTGIVNTFWISMLMWTLMGLGMSGIGLSVMHDANHGAYSKNAVVNNVLGFLSNFLGAYHINWKIQHNVLHHSFTNVEGMDEDIQNPVMRFSPGQERKPIFKYQAFYAPFLYGLMTINWFLVKDIQQLIRYKKKNLISTQGLSFKTAMRKMLFNKLWYITLTLIIPMIVMELPWYQVVLGFLLMQFICGLMLALIFQPAHVIENTMYATPSPTGTVENSWAIHQMLTTTNFANKSRLFSWFIGGLNFQIEHHLFPNICHIHYKRISKIVQETAKEYGVPYYQHKTFASAVKSHFAILNKLGTGAYDKSMA